MEHCVVTGNLGKDAETYFTKDNKPIVSFSICSSRRSTVNGEEKEYNEWFNVKVFGKLAELAADTLTKGTNVIVEGRMHTGSYVNKEGVKIYTFEIIANNIGISLFNGGGQPNRQNTEVPVGNNRFNKPQTGTTGFDQFGSEVDGNQDIIPF